MQKQKQVKILLAAAIYPPDPGGPALHAKEFYDWLGRYGVEREVFVLNKYKYLPPVLRHLAYARKLWSLSKNKNVVYAYDAVGVGLPALLSTKLHWRRKPFVVRVGGDVAWERACERDSNDLSMLEWYKAREHEGNLRYKLTRFVLRRASRIVVPSALLADLYEEYYGIQAERLAVIPNPVPTKEAEQRFENPRTFIFASRLVPYKNLDFVLDALSYILPDYGDVKILIMGDGPERGRLEARARALDIDTKVEFTGKISQEEVMRHTATCYAGLAPALTEFNPNYILQCLAYNKPFLMSRENGLPFRVPEEFLFDPRNQSEFVEKFKYMLSEEGYTEAKSLVRDIDFNSTWDQVLKANLEIIEGL